MEENKEVKKYRKIGPYILLKQIGKGSFSTVYEARKGVKGPILAIKQISLVNLKQKQVQRITQEVNTLSVIKHENIIHLIDFQQTVHNLYLVFQHCKYTDLNNYIKDNYNGVLPQEKVKRIMIQLKQAFKIIREHKIVHRDLKLQNILVTQDFQIKLADFGFAKFLDQNQFFKSYVGTVMTMAPEVFQKKKYNQKCDIWSLGIIAYEMLFGCNPFFKKDKMTKTQIEQTYNKKLQFPSKISSKAQDLISKMLMTDPQKRIQFSTFFEHSWLSQKQNINLKQILRQQCLKNQLQKSLSNSMKNKLQKEYILNNCQDIIAYSFIQFVKNYIQNSLTSWINIAKHILDMQFQNDILRMVSLSMLIQNIDHMLSANLNIKVNGQKNIVIPEYMQLRNLQTWPMSQYTKRLPNFLLKSKANIEEFLEYHSEELLILKKSNVPWSQLLLRQLKRQAEPQNDKSFLKVFLKIKPWLTDHLSISIQSSILTKGAIDIIIRSLSLKVKYDDLCKKCGNIFKLKIIFEEIQESKELKQLKELILYQ